MSEEKITATGYDPYERFFASKFRQGGRVTYGLNFTLANVVEFLPEPDADKVLDVGATQRRIKPAHARGFGEYVRANDTWVAPPLLLRGPPDIFRFEELEQIDAGPTQFGTLGISKAAKSEIAILDGQHRVLGFHLAWKRLHEDIGKARSTLAQARSNGEPSVIAFEEDVLAKLIELRDRLASEGVSIQILEVAGNVEIKRIFADINDNALGITGAIRSRFDDRKVVNRALNKLLEEAAEDPGHFLANRVDIEQDRVSGNSRYLLGAKHVADIVRALVVGNGRVGKQMEKDLDPTQIAKGFDEFSRTLVASFPLLADLVQDRLTPAELRQQHLIGSSVTMRVLAATWHDLRQKKWSVDRIQSAFSQMAPHLGAPVYASAEDTLFRTTKFTAKADGVLSPRSAAQDLKSLTSFFVASCEADNFSTWTRATESSPDMLPTNPEIPPLDDKA